MGRSCRSSSTAARGTPLRLAPTLPPTAAPNSPARPRSRPPVDALVAQVRQESDGLHRLAQAHLVSQDAVEPVLPQADHPLDALELVVAQVAGEQRAQLLQGCGGGVGVGAVGAPGAAGRPCVQPAHGRKMPWEARPPGGAPATVGTCGPSPSPGRQAAQPSPKPRGGSRPAWASCQRPPPPPPPQRSGPASASWRACPWPCLWPPGAPAPWHRRARCPGP
jgi:hypothetical protein